jgi:hydroxymethylglutaryl-CoA synthase
MGGILSYGAYVPYHRLERSAIGAALGLRGGRGSRSVASYDEDTTSMGVEAARAALRDRFDADRLDSLWFSTVDPAYLDKTNASTLHAALALDQGVRASDRNGSVRSAVLGLVDAFESSAARTELGVLSDIRTGRAGGADETEGGDAAVAFVTGPGGEASPDLVELVATASASAEFLDRWRVPGQGSSKVWEERFGEFAYIPLADAAFAEALKRAAITPDEIDHLVVTGTQSRAVRRFVSASGVASEAITDDLSSAIGAPGAAHLGLVLADVLDRAAPGALIVAVSVSDGADVLVLRATDALASYREGRETVRAQIENGRSGLAYADFLTWRGQLRREPPRRPDPDRPAAPPSFRAEAWKFAFEGSRCTARLDSGAECGMRHLPPQRVCVRCHAVDQMVPERFADSRGTVATFTVDRLAYSPSPPLVAAVIDFDEGGRFRCELTDVDAEQVAIGDRVEMTFRSLYVADGVHDYFWKARPIREVTAAKP